VFLTGLLGRGLPKAGVIAVVLESFLRSANQASAKAACELLGWSRPRPPMTTTAPEWLPTWSANRRREPVAQVRVLPRALAKVLVRPGERAAGGAC